jgi:hypothetical protein
MTKMSVSTDNLQWFARVVQKGVQLTLQPSIHINFKSLFTVVTMQPPALALQSATGAAPPLCSFLLSKCECSSLLHPLF